MLKLRSIKAEVTPATGSTRPMSSAGDLELDKRLLLNKFAPPTLYPRARSGQEDLNERSLHHPLFLKHAASFSAISSNEQTPLLPTFGNPLGTKHQIVRVFGMPRQQLTNELDALSRLAFKMVLSGVVDFIPSFVSGVLTGRLSTIHSQDFMAARALASLFLMLTAYTANIGIGIAMDTLCAQAFGAGKPHELGLFVQTGVLIFCCFFPFMVTAGCFCTELLVLLGQRHDIALLAKQLVVFTLPSLPFTIINDLLCRVLQGQNIVMPMVVAGMVGNVVHNGFIYYLMFHTSLGFVGSAVALGLQQVAYFVVICGYFYSSHLYQKDWPGLQLREALRVLPEFVKLGVSGLLMFIFEYWGFAAVALIAGLLTDAKVAISATAIYTSFRILCAIFCFSVSVSGSVRVGNALGANEPELAKIAAYLAVGINVVISIATTVFMILLREVFPRAHTEDVSVIRMTSLLMLATCPFQVFSGITSAIHGIMRGSGQQQLGAKLNFVTYLALGLPIGLTLAFQFHFGLVGLWLGVCLAFVFNALYGLYWLRNANWDQLARDAVARTSEPSDPSPQRTTL